MKSIKLLGACALVAAGVVTSSTGQVQVAGNLVVNVDATTAPVGTYTALANSGTLGGLFVVTNHFPGNNTGVSPQIIAAGGTGTHGILLDGNSFLNHYTDGTSYIPVTPPANLTGPTPVFSVEVWVAKSTVLSEYAAVSWGRRDTGGAEVSCNYGYNGSWGGFSWWGGGYDWPWGSVPAAGRWHHLVWTYDGAGNLSIYCDGVRDSLYTQTSTLNVSSTNNILIGAQHNGNGTTISGLFAGVIGKVRIHDGVLTPAQVSNNYSYEAPSFTIPADAVLASAPLHRYSFNLPATNNALGLTVPDTGTAAGAPALIQGSNVVGALPTFDGDQLVLPSYGSQSYITNSYVDLPNGLLSSLSSSNGGPGQISLELWVNYRSANDWAELLYFGSSTIGEITGPGAPSGYAGANGIVIPGSVNTSADQSGFRGAAGDKTISARLVGTRKHIVLTWDELSNLVKLYHEGIQVGQFNANVKMNAIVDVNNWLGRSGWPDANARASYREFRIYNRVLSGSEVRRNYLIGPSDVSDNSTLAWNGNVNGNWDFTTANWIAGGTSMNFTNGSTILFGDNATGTTTISLAGAVTPGATLAVDSVKDYTFGGPGKISGTGGLTKAGSGTLTISGLANDYTGANVVAGGKLIVSSMANGGFASAIGASSANPSNLQLGGGTLSYQGPSATIDRGYYVTDTNSSIEVQNALTISGSVFAGGNGAFVKAGPGTLTYSTVGSNLLSGGAFPGYKVAQGQVVFDGTGGGQTNRNMSEFWIGSSLDSAASVTLTNTVMFMDSWVSVGRRNGTIGNSSKLTLNNSAVTITGNGLSLGFNGGLPGYKAAPVATLNGNSILSIPGTGNNVNVGESPGAFGTLSINDNSWLRCATPRLGVGLNATGAVYLAGSSTWTNAAFMSIGTGAGTNGVGSGGVGLFVAKDNAVVSSTGDFNVTDLANSVGELDISNNATFYINSTMYIGKGVGTVATVNQAGGTVLKYGGGDFLIAGNATAASSSVGTWNLIDGVLSVNGNLQPGAYGSGTFNQSGGTCFVGGWTSIARRSGSIGVANISGGSLNTTNPTADLIVGEIGFGTLNVRGTAAVNIAGQLRLGNASGASGTVNLDGGTIVTRRVWMGNASASSFFNFNGGLLQAAPGANSDFMSGLSSAIVSPGGARIDSAGNDIIIAQDLFDGGGGGLTKLGAGTLTLSGYLSYSGPTAVNGGKLAISTRSTATGAITVADAAELSVSVVDFPGATISPASLTAGGSAVSKVTVNLGNSFGNPASAPINVSGGTVTASGRVAVGIDPSSTVAVGEIPLISYGALVGAQNLELGSLPPGVEGYLTNDVAAVPNFIGIVVTTVRLPRWEGLAGGFWDDQVTTNWINMSSGLPDYYYQGARAVFDDQALGTTSVNLVTNVTPGGVVVSNSTLVYTISGTGRIGGNAGLTKAGSGTLTLSTTNNNYTGPTLIDGPGTLLTTVPNNLGNNSALVVTNAGLLSLGTNSQKFSSTTLANGTIASTGATITATSHNLDNGSVGAILAGGTLTTFGAITDSVTVLAGNTYSGRTLLGGSTLVITNIANGGAASSIGTSSSSPTNLVFAGGGLSYQGPAATTDRGYSATTGGTLSVSGSGDLTVAGPVLASAGAFYKAGPGQVNVTALGTNQLSGGGYYIGAGTLLLSGAMSSTNYLQTNRVTGDIWVGYDQVNAGNLVLTNTSLAISAWLAIDRGNGTLGSSSKVTLYDSLVTSGNFSLGYANGIAGNSSFSVLKILGNSSLTTAGTTYVGEDAGADARIIVAGNSRITQTANWFALGNAGKGTMMLSNNATVTLPGDYNLGDLVGGDGTLIIADNATNLAATLYVGKGTTGASSGSVQQYGGYMGRSSGGGDWRIGGNSSTATAGSVGAYNLYGGVFEPAGNFQIGAWGSGTWNQSGGIANCSSYPVVGRYPGSIGVATVSGGVFNQTGTGQLLIIGEEGNGTLTVTNTGVVTSANGISIGHTATGVGVVNLGGGRLITTRVFQNGGAGASSTFNFNGGVLQANANNANFMTGLGAANVLARGAFIDSSNYNITIAQPLAADLNSPGGGLTKLGTGILALSGANTYTGPTTVSQGGLAVNGSIASAVTVNTGAALAGNGTVNGVVTVQPGAAISAGPGVGIGALTLTASPVLGGIVLAEVDRNGGTPLADLITVTGNPINYSGILAVTNTGADLVAGDRFKLFEASGYNGTFTLLSFTPRQIVTWNTAGLSSGTITVQSVAPALPTTPTNIVAVVVGSNLEISWPSDYTGWILQGQTNSINVGISGNWATVPGSAATNRMFIPINPANPTAYYRLTHP